MKRALILAGAAAATLVAAWSVEAKTPEAPQGAGAAVASVKQTIETRQASLKDMGKAFKAISDQTKAGAPDMALIKTSADTVKKYATDIGKWFPAGSGAASGVKTGALDKIWSDPTGFAAAVAKLQDESGKLQTAVASGDVNAVKAQFRNTGGACKNCHDTYRKPEEH